MHHSTDRIAHTMAFVTPVVEHWLEREIAQWVHLMNDRSDERSYHGATSRSQRNETLELVPTCFSLLVKQGPAVQCNWKKGRKDIFI